MPNLNSPDWERVALLMQPAMIRVIDHLRKAVEASAWKGRYESFQSWPEGTSAAVQAEVNALVELLEVADDQQYEQLLQQMAQMPQPVQMYLLHLEQEGQQRTLNVWELCYKVSLVDYEPDLTRREFREPPPSQMVPDMDLFENGGEVDWNRLDAKVARVVAESFAHL